MCRPCRTILIFVALISVAFPAGAASVQSLSCPAPYHFIERLYVSGLDTVGLPHDTSISTAILRYCYIEYSQSEMYALGYYCPGVPGNVNQPSVSPIYVSSPINPGEWNVSGYSCEFTPIIINEQDVEVPGNSNPYSSSNPLGSSKTNYETPAGSLSHPDISPLIGVGSSTSSLGGQHSIGCTFQGGGGVSGGTYGGCSSTYDSTYSNCRLSGTTAICDKHEVYTYTPWGTCTAAPGCSGTSVCTCSNSNSDTTIPGTIYNYGNYTTDSSGDITCPQYMYTKRESVPSPDGNTDVFQYNQYCSASDSTPSGLSWSGSSLIKSSTVSAKFGSEVAQNSSISNLSGMSQEQFYQSGNDGVQNVVGALDEFFTQSKGSIDTVSSSMSDGLQEVLSTDYRAVLLGHKVNDGTLETILTSPFSSTDPADTEYVFATTPSGYQVKFTLSERMKLEVKKALGFLFPILTAIYVFQTLADVTSSKGV